MFREEDEDVYSAAETKVTLSPIRVQRVRSEDSNLYFNAKSAWRWCEFTAHPRVVLYADRTGAELTDIRVSPASFHTLFRISAAAECHRGERLILSRYLGDAHPFHHLITTQVSRQEAQLTGSNKCAKRLRVQILPFSVSTQPTSWTSASRACRCSSGIT